MRKLLPALAVALAVLIPASAAFACVHTPPRPVQATACISLPDLHLPSVCDIKAGTLKLATDLAVQIGLSVNATLAGALRLVGGITASLPNILNLLLSLPPLIVAKLLCL